MYYISYIDRLTLFQKWNFHIFKTKHEATFKKIVNSKTARLNNIYLFDVKKKKKNILYRERPRNIQYTMLGYLGFIVSSATDLVKLVCVTGKYLKQ